MRLRATMDNGATVSDWLGTAMTAARVAGRYIEDVREGSMQADSDLAQALEYLAQATSEVQAVLALADR